MNKQEAITILAGRYCIPVENGADKFASEINKAIDMAIEALTEQPKGEWIDDCTCSNCNWLNEDDDGRILLTTYNYCPNCGAKMRGYKE